MCVLTGRPAQRYQRVIFTYVPTWTWLLLLFGIIPCLIARWFTAQKIATALPMSEQARTAYRRWRHVTKAAGFGGIALVVVGALAEVPVMAWAGAAFLVAATVAVLLLLLWFVTVEPAEDPELLVIRRAHQRFAAAVRS